MRRPGDVEERGRRGRGQVSDQGAGPDGGKGDKCGKG